MAGSPNVIHYDNGVGESVEKALEDLGEGSSTYSRITIVYGDRTILREEGCNRIGVVAAPCRCVSGGEVVECGWVNVAESRAESLLKPSALLRSCLDQLQPVVSPHVRQT